MLACRARLAGNSAAIANHSNAAAAAEEQPNVEIMLTRVLTAVEDDALRQPLRNLCIIVAKLAQYRAAVLA